MQQKKSLRINEFMQKATPYNLDIYKNLHPIIPLIESRKEPLAYQIGELGAKSAIAHDYISCIKNIHFHNTTISENNNIYTPDGLLSNHNIVFEIKTAYNNNILAIIQNIEKSMHSYVNINNGNVNIHFYLDCSNINKKYNYISLLENHIYTQKKNCIMYHKCEFKILESNPIIDTNGEILYDICKALYM